MNEELTTNSCKPISYEDSIENKVVVGKGSILRPEFRHANHQLMLCTGGFGAQANARGRTCYCISLYDGRKTSFSVSYTHLDVYKRQLLELLEICIWTK